MCIYIYIYIYNIYIYIFIYILLCGGKNALFFVFTKPAGNVGLCVGHWIFIHNKCNELMLIVMITVSFTVYEPIINVSNSISVKECQVVGVRCFLSTVHLVHGKRPRNIRNR